MATKQSFPTWTKQQYNSFCEWTKQLRISNPGYREGQILYNALALSHESGANNIPNGYNPFHNDANIPCFMDMIIDAIQ